MRSRPALRLVQERKLAELIALPESGAVLEASGVLASGRDCFVIFDNVRRVARIHRDLVPGTSRHAWLGRQRSGEGYEDIAYSPHQRRYYLLIEAEKRRGDWTIEGAGRQYDFPRTRKGKLLYSTVEGISWLSDETFVAVSDLTKEGHPSRCRAKDQSIHIFRLPRSGSSRRRD